MVSVGKLINQSDYVMCVLGIFFHEILKELSLTLCKLMIKFSIPCDFNRHHFVLPTPSRILPVPAGHDLSETALAKYLHNLVPVGQLIPYPYLIVPLLIVIRRPVAVVPAFQSESGEVYDLLLDRVVQFFD